MKQFEWVLKDHQGSRIAYRYYYGDYYMLATYNPPMEMKEGYFYWDVCKIYPPDEEHMGLEYSICLESGKKAKSLKEAMKQCEKAFNFWRINEKR